MQLDIGHERMFASGADGSARAWIRWRTGMSRPPTLDLSIREARADDAQQVAALLGELGYPTRPEQFAGRFARLDAEPAVWLFVAETGDRVVGLAGLRVLALVERDEPVGRLIALVVGAKMRGMGVGRALVAHVEERARHEGCVELDLSSSDRREGAHAFYRRLGFADVSRRFVKDLTPAAASGPRARR
jgi:GNAT superfamily N-acetyltransferase